MIYTFISLINVEAGINVKGGQNLQSNKCGGWNKSGGWKNYKCGGWKFTFVLFLLSILLAKSINNICPIAVKILKKFLSECYNNRGVAPQGKF